METGEAMEIGTYPYFLVSSQRKFRVKLRNVIKPSYKYTQLQQSHFEFPGIFFLVLLLLLGSK